MNVFVFGSGKMGRALAGAAKRARMNVQTRARREGLPRRRVDADLLVLAVRDGDLAPLAASLADAKLVSRKTACVHVAGALDENVLASLRNVSAGVAQMHPMMAVASTAHPPSLRGGNVHVRGDAAAVRRARSFARGIGMVPRTFPALDVVGYHAAAGLVANGAAALAAMGGELLVRSGVPSEAVPKLLGPLLASVAENVAAIGFPGALTGPVRRGDVRAVAAHLALLDSHFPAAIPFYLESVRAQLPLARALGEAEGSAFDEIARWLDARTTAR